MKYFFILIMLFMLFGCYYSNGCIYTPQMVNCYVDKGKGWPSIAQFQKLETIGKTDSQQRWKDAVNCGSKYGDQDLLYINEKDKYNEFKQCMENKGYHRFWPAECGYQDPKWDKKKCNL